MWRSLSARSSDEISKDIGNSSQGHLLAIAKYENVPQVSITASGILSGGASSDPLRVTKDIVTASGCKRGRESESAPSAGDRAGPENQCACYR
jgi:hypothetical protein